MELSTREPNLVDQGTGTASIGGRYFGLTEGHFADVVIEPDGRVGALGDSVEDAADDVHVVIAVLGHTVH
jgi:hypothetical protein